MVNTLKEQEREDILDAISTRNRWNFAYRSLEANNGSIPATHLLLAKYLCIVSNTSWELEWTKSKDWKEPAKNKIGVSVILLIRVKFSKLNLLRIPMEDTLFASFTKETSTARVFLGNWWEVRS